MAYQVDHSGLDSFGFRDLGISSRLLGLVYMESTREEHDNNKNGVRSKKRSICHFPWGTKSPRHPQLTGASSKAGMDVGVQCRRGLRGHLQLLAELWELRDISKEPQKKMGPLTELQFPHL